MRPGTGRAASESESWYCTVLPVCIWNLGTPWYHIGYSKLLTTPYDIIGLWYRRSMISWLGDLWYQCMDIKYGYFWCHSHDIIYCFQQLTISYMISYSLISYMISQIWYHIMFSTTYYILYDIICLDIIFCCLSIEIIKWFHCMTSCFDSIHYILYDVKTMISCYDVKILHWMSCYEINSEFMKS